MNKFLKKTFLVSLPLICGMCILDLFITHNLKKSHNFQGEIEVWNDIYKGEIDADIAIYGDSRAWTQINPNILATTLNKSVYNFGVDGHNFWIQYLRHIEYIEHNPKPKIILLNVDIYTLEKRENLYNLEQFLPYALWNKNIKEYTASYNGFTKKDYYVPFLRYTGKTRAIKDAYYNFINNDTNNYRNLGYKSFNLKWKEKKDITNKIDEYFIQLDKKSIKLFERFITECKELNIELILIYTPEHIIGQNKITNRLEVVNLYQQFSKKHKLPFLNYSKDTLQLKKKYFYNSMHLNNKGSFIMSHKIANKLKKILDSQNFNKIIH